MTESKQEPQHNDNVANNQRKPQEGQPLNTDEQQIANNELNDSNGFKAHGKVAKDEPQFPADSGGSRLHKNKNNA